MIFLLGELLHVLSPGLVFSANHILGNVLGARKTALNKTDEIPTLIKCIFQESVHSRRETKLISTVGKNQIVLSARQRLKRKGLK